MANASVAATSSPAKSVTAVKAAKHYPRIPMKFLKALFEGFAADSKKGCGKCDNCTCSQPKSSFYDKYCEENPWADQCKIYED